MKKRGNGLIVFLAQLVISIAMMLLAYKIGDVVSQSLETKTDKRR